LLKKYHSTNICILLSLIFWGILTAGGPLPGSADQLIIYPPPPDSTRIQFLTSFSTSTDITGGRSGILRYILGAEEARPIFKPYGIASSKGKIYICDTQLGGLEIIDLEQKKFDYFQPRGRGQIFKPINCTLDDKGYLYIADTERNQIVIFDADLNYFNSIGNPTEFKPTDVSYFGGDIWVCNLKAKRIEVFSGTSLTLVKSFPDAASSDPEFLFSPTNLFVTESQVYVSDFGDFRIKIFNHQGQFVKSLGSYGQAPGQFVRPKGIAVDTHNFLYVTDAGFENVQMFDEQGQLLMFFGGNYKGPGDMWLPAKVCLDYENLAFFQKYVDDAFKLKYLIYVTNQFGPDKINVYGFVEYR